MPRTGLTFDDVWLIGRTLPDVAESANSRGRGLKIKGRLLACQAIDKSTEPNTLMVRISPTRRKALLAESPKVFYLTDHYAGYPAILVRLSRIDRDTLRELLTEAWEFVIEGVK